MVREDSREDSRVGLVLAGRRYKVHLRVTEGV